VAPNVSNIMERQKSTDYARRSGLLVKLGRRRGLMAGVFCTIFGLTIAALIVLPVRYLASGSIIIAEEEPGIDNASPVWAQKVGDPADLESQLLVIRSPRVMRLAMTNPGAVDAVWQECEFAAKSVRFRWLAASMAASCDKLKPDSDALVDHIQSGYLVGGVGRSRVINVAYQSPLPDVAQKLANALITAFLDDQRANISTGRQVAADWLWQELRQLDAELQDEDAKIQAYRRTKGLMRGANAPITSERLTSISQQLSGAEAARAEAAARLQEINADQARGSSNSPAVLASRAVADLKQQLTAVTGQFASTSYLLGPNHPARRALQRELDILKERLAGEVAVVAASAQRSYDAADALVTSLKRQMETVKAEVATATTDEASIENMVRSSEIKRRQYSDLYKRASELETERRVLLGSTRLVSLAELPNKPFFPKRMPFLAAGFTIAVLLAIAAALLRDRSDCSVRASSELTLVTGAPTVAQLPQLRMGSANTVQGFFSIRRRDLSLAPALKKGRNDAKLQNALRKLHAALVLAGGSRKFRTILVTSPASREGKTFTTLALAQFVAATGRRVLAVECDMRCPTFESALALDIPFGLADVLRGTIQPRNAVITTATPNLDVIPAGHSTADSTELLMGKSMSELLLWAQGYDLVLIDSPPSDIVMDACMLSKRIDGVLCCTRWGHSSMTDVVATIGGIRDAGGDVLGTVITMVNPDDHALYEPMLAPAGPYLKVS
jgi:succinoglycan biosynthesis transport protein ExoP